MQTLNRFLQQVIVGITTLDGVNVRPRWQPEPPNLPAANVNWAAFGIVSRSPETFAAIVHNPAGQGSDTLLRHEIIDVLTSFYGPDADDYAMLLSDGLQIAQNREVLQLAKMGLVETGDIVIAPSLVKDKWLYRVDLKVSIRRLIQRSYPVLNLLSAQGSIAFETGTVAIITP